MGQGNTQTFAMFEVHSQPFVCLSAISSFLPPSQVVSWNLAVDWYKERGNNNVWDCSNKRFILAKNAQIFREIRNKLTSTDWEKEFHSVGFFIDFGLCQYKKNGLVLFQLAHLSRTSIVPPSCKQHWHRRHLGNNMRTLDNHERTTYELFTKAVVCSTFFRHGIDRFKRQQPFWEMASTVYEREICGKDRVVYLKGRYWSRWLLFL